MSNVIQMPKVSRSTFYSPILTFIRLCYKPHLKVCPQNNFCIISREMMNFDIEEFVREDMASDANLNPQ